MLWSPLDTFQAATFRSAVGLIGYIVLDRPDCQCGESGEECCRRAYESRLDAHDASGQVPRGTQRTRMALSGAGCA